MNQAPLFPIGYVLSDGRYKIKETLGRGGMGIVQKALDRYLEIEVAIKFQIPEAPEDAKKLFIREARAMAKLSGHSNIVSIFNIGVCLKSFDDAPEYINYIASEYLPGGDARKLVKEIREEKTLEKTIEAMKVGISVCNGIDYAHEKAGILHRDIKPANILIGVEDVVKVSDFGLAKVAKDKSGTFTGKSYGTVAYMAPEQADLEHEPNVKIDIWQLGITLYELLTGELPRRPMQGPQKKPADINEHIPGSVSDCIMEMLNESPEERLDSCRYVKEQLQRELDLIDPKKRYSQKRKILELQEFSNIRHALREQIEQGIQTLVDDAVNGASILPKPDEQQRWYATILMRPSIRIGRNRSLAKKFSTIFFAEYLGLERTAHSDWEKKADLITQALPIMQCSSGLPIRWYQERGNWSRDQEKNLFHCQKDKRNFIRYFALKNIKWARFEDSEDNLIKRTYATDTSRASWDRSVGWELQTENSSQTRFMSQNIETEIIIPIYSPFSQNKFGSDNSVLGVANFEWDHGFPDWKIEEIGTILAAEIQDENCFSLSEFVCDILPNIVMNE